MTIYQRIQELQQLINQSAKDAGRSAESIHLLAVSKGQSAQAMEEAYQAGLRHFGENYLQEAETKMKALQQLPICWHFIGPIQSNKTKAIAEQFSWVHSVGREKIAALLSAHRPSNLPDLNICIQVNLDNEDSKSGVSPGQLPELAAMITHLPRLKLRGLMTIPLPREGEEQQYLSLLRLKHLFDDLNKQSGLTMDTLSMGMTDDLTAAIRAGSTILRIGRKLFGERQG